MLPAEEIFFRYRFHFLVIFLGLILVALGLFFSKGLLLGSKDKIEVLESTSGAEGTSAEIVVEIAGEVEKPGVYKLTKDARVEDALIAAGGISADADRTWMEKTLNRAAKLADGQKIYIPEHSKSSSAKNSGVYQNISDNSAQRGSGLININTASLSELDTLPGIGPVYGQNIVEHRPYSNASELVSKGALKQNVFEKIKDKITVF